MKEEKKFVRSLRMSTASAHGINSYEEAKQNIENGTVGEREDGQSIEKKSLQRYTPSNMYCEG